MSRTIEAEPHRQRSQAGTDGVDHQQIAIYLTKRTQVKSGGSADTRWMSISAPRPTPTSTVPRIFGGTGLAAASVNTPRAGCATKSIATLGGEGSVHEVAAQQSSNDHRSADTRKHGDSIAQHHARGTRVAERAVVDRDRARTVLRQYSTAASAAARRSHRAEAGAALGPDRCGIRESCDPGRSRSGDTQDCRGRR